MNTTRNNSYNPMLPSINHPEEDQSMKTISRILYFLLGVIEILLLARFLLLLFGANLEAGFAQLVKILTDPLMFPFVGLFPPRMGETIIFSSSTLVAMVVYAILFYGIVKLIKILKSRNS